LAAVGAEVLELRTDRDGDTASILAMLRAEGIAGTDAFIVGTTITVPLRAGAAGDIAAAVAGLGVRTSTMITRPPTLDDVYLRLTGDRIAA